MKVILNANGQVILILLLIMSVALAVGLSVVQRSLTDVSTAAKIDQSSRAFSAAEAGIERALSQPAVGFLPTALDNNAAIGNVDNLPVPGPGLAVEYPQNNKEEIAQVWLATPQNLSDTVYDGATLDVFWGDPNVSAGDEPAIEIGVTYESRDNPSKYLTKKYFFDPVINRDNGFVHVTTCSSIGSIAFSDQSPVPKGKTFYCKTTLDLNEDITNESKLILVRARLLYTRSPHPIAVAPESGKSLPTQGRVITSVGISGETQRKVQLFQVDKVVPFYYDYALFAADEIEKQPN